MVCAHFFLFFLELQGILAVSYSRDNLHIINDVAIPYRFLFLVIFTKQDFPLYPHTDSAYSPTIRRMVLMLQHLL